MFLSFKLSTLARTTDEEISLKMQMCCDRTRLGFPPPSVLLCYGGGGDCGGGAAMSRLESTRASLRLQPALRLPAQP